MNSAPKHFRPTPVYTRTVSYKGLLRHHEDLQIRTLLNTFNEKHSATPLCPSLPTAQHFLYSTISISFLFDATFPFTFPAAALLIYPLHSFGMMRCT
jgi:hypothetical protein